MSALLDEPSFTSSRIRAVCREVTPECIPEMRLLGKLLSGEPLTADERMYAREAEALEAQDRLDQLANEADERALADAKATEEWDLWLSDERGESDLIEDTL